MRTLVLFPALLFVFIGSLAIGEDVVTEADATMSVIQSGLERMKSIRMMKIGHKYTATVKGTEHTAQKEFFLRKRGPVEILSSNISSGCGDYAFAFYCLMQAQDLDVMLVDGAEMTAMSLFKLQANHTGVAVHNKKRNRWILVDPTSRRIVSEHWDERSPIYQGMYFVTFKGSLEEYRSKVTDWDSLTRMHEAGLRNAPKALLKQEIVDLDFVVDDSMRNDEGELDQRTTSFLERASMVTEAAVRQIGFPLEQKARVRLVRGENRLTSTVEYSKDNLWVCRVGSNSAMSMSLLSYVERAVKQRMYACQTVAESNAQNFGK